MVALMLPLMVLNILGGIISGIWLGILGQWYVLLIGIVAALFGHKVLNVGIMIGMGIFGTPAMALERKGKRTGAMFFAVLNLLYIAFLICLWCFGILLLLGSFVNTAAPIPMMIWSYGVATGPWAYLSQKDQEAGGNEFSAISTIFAQVAFVAMGLAVIFTDLPFFTLAVIFGSIMLVSVIVNSGIAFRYKKLEQASKDANFDQ